MSQIDASDEVVRKQLEPLRIDCRGLLHFARDKIVVTSLGLKAPRDRHAIAQGISFLFWGNRQYSPSLDLIGSAESRIGQRKVWIHLNGTLIQGFSGLEIVHDVVFIPLCEKLQRLRRRACGQLERLVKLRN